MNIPEMAPTELWAVKTSHEGVWAFTASPTQREAMKKFNDAAIGGRILCHPLATVTFVRVTGSDVHHEWPSQEKP